MGGGITIPHKRRIEERQRPTLVVCAFMGSRQIQIQIQRQSQRRRQTKMEKQKCNDKTNTNKKTKTGIKR